MLAHGYAAPPTAPPKPARRPFHNVQYLPRVKDADRLPSALKLASSYPTDDGSVDLYFIDDHDRDVCRR